MEKEREERFKKFEGRLVALMIEEKVAVVPRIEYMNNGLHTVLGFEIIPEDKIEEYKKRIAQ